MKTTATDSYLSFSCQNTFARPSRMQAQDKRTLGRVDLCDHCPAEVALITQTAQVRAPSGGGKRDLEKSAGSWRIGEKEIDSPATDDLKLRFPLTLRVTYLLGASDCNLCLLGSGANHDITMIRGLSSGAAASTLSVVCFNLCSIPTELFVLRMISLNLDALHATTILS